MNVEKGVDTIQWDSGVSSGNDGFIIILEGGDSCLVFGLRWHSIIVIN